MPLTDLFNKNMGRARVKHDTVQCHNVIAQSDVPTCLIRIICSIGVGLCHELRGWNAMYFFSLPLTMFWLQICHVWLPSDLFASVLL